MSQLKALFKTFSGIYKNPLYRNSFWLMAGAFMMAGVGFFYWLIAARLYTPTQIGLGATFLSVAAIVNLFAMLGFSTTLIRYLPKSDTKAKKINTAFTSICLAAFIFGIIYLCGVHVWTPQLSFFLSSVPIILLILFFFPFNILNTITDSVFTAFNAGEWVFFSNTVQSVSKLILLIVMPSLGVWGIINSNIIGVILAVLLCLTLINRRFGIQFCPLIDRDVVEKVKKFALGNYLASLISGLPPLLLPILITNKISAEQTAYFYMPNMIASLLIIIPTMISRSYLAQGSHMNEVPSMKKPLVFSYALMIPLTLCAIIFGKLLLTLFGHNYANGGYTYLVLISISVLISVVNYFLGTKLQIEHKINKLITVNLVGSVLYLSSAWCLTFMGIAGIGLAAIITQIFTVIFLLM